MSKPKNLSGTEVVTLSLSDESVRVLHELAVLGIYGKNEAEVAGRFVDTALKEFVVPPRYKLPLRKGNKRSLAQVSDTEDSVVATSQQQRKRTRKR